MEKLLKNFCNKKWKSTDLLTEDDIRCKLFYYLELNKKKINIWNYSLHSEVRWYWNNTNKKLKYRSDLVYINNNWLVDNNIILPSKGYKFDKYKILMEIKFRRTNWESDNVFLSKIKEDLDKISEIKDRTTLDSSDNNKEYYLIVFDKKYNIISKIENLDIPIYIKIFYKKL